MDEKFPLALPEGTILAGQYMIEKVLGQGGFGITYRAIDHKTNQKVAVKEFFPDTLAYREMTTVISYPGERSESYVYGKESFLQEAQTLAEFIGNENIVRIHSYFEENGTAYFVMDYIEGKSLDEYIKEKGGKISVEEAKNILIPMMDALNIVHSKGIVHRDVTPDNIYLTDDGTVKLLDFGAARYSLGDKSRSLDVILKHGFAPKEQYTRRGKQGPFTDIYSLGATFYFAITGKRPPDSVERLDEDDLIPPSNLGVDITEYQERAILQALSVQPAERFQTMADFKSVLLNESNVKNQIFFTAPEKAAAPAGNQEQSAAYRQTPVVPQISPSVQQQSSGTQNTNSLMQKLKQMNQKKMIAGIVGVLVVIFFIGYVVSNSKTGRDDNRTGSGSVSYQPSAEYDSGKEGNSSAETKENGTSGKSGLIVVGNTPANLGNGGTIAGDGIDLFYTDNDRHYLNWEKNGVIDENETGRFSCLSYYDGILYYLNEGKAYRWNRATETKEAIPELAGYDNISTLYITTDFYFIYQYRNIKTLYRISRKTGKEEDSINIDPPESFYDGWFYYLEDQYGTSGTTKILRVSASDFDDFAEDYLEVYEGFFHDLVVDGGYCYGLYTNGYDVNILKFNSDLKDFDDNACAWDISSLVNKNEQNFNYAQGLNVMGDNLFFVVGEEHEVLLYHIVVSGNSNGADSDYSYELIDSSAYNLGFPNITEYKGYFEVTYEKTDEEDKTWRSMYVSFDSSTNKRIEE